MINISIEQFNKIIDKLRSDFPRNPFTKGRNPVVASSDSTLEQNNLSGKVSIAHNAGYNKALTDLVREISNKTATPITYCADYDVEFINIQQNLTS